MRQALRFLRVVWRAAPRRRRIFWQALALLAGCRAALRCVPFPRLAVWFSRPVRGTKAADEARRRLCADVRWAVDAASLCLPGKTVCFPRAIVAQALLRRRGVATDLYYGAALLPDKGLTAHVWLRSGEVGVVGCREAGPYRVLACYSGLSRSPRSQANTHGKNRHL